MNARDIPQPPAPTTMLYRAPGDHFLHGHWLDYVIVEDEYIEQMLADGWCLSTEEAATRQDAAPTPASVAVEAEPGVWIEEAPAITVVPVDAVSDAPPTRAELEQRARELGIRFDGRTTDRTLASRIEDAHRVD